MYLRLSVLATPLFQRIYDLDFCFVNGCIWVYIIQEVSIDLWKWRININIILPSVKWGWRILRKHRMSKTVCERTLISLTSLETSSYPLSFWRSTQKIYIKKCYCMSARTGPLLFLQTFIYYSSFSWSPNSHETLNESVWPPPLLQTLWCPCYYNSFTFVPILYCKGSKQNIEVIREF